MRGSIGVRSLILLAYSAALLASEPAFAQTIRGRVQEFATRTPINAVEVYVLDNGGAVLARTTTDTLGIFVLSWSTTERVRMEARRLGLLPFRSEELVVRRGEAVSTRILLSASAVPVNPLIVSSRAFEGDIAGNLADFQKRRQLGIGHFLDRDQIRQTGATHVSQVLTRIPGITLLPMPGNPTGVEAFTTVNTALIGGTGTARASRSGRGIAPPASGPCPMQIYLNGHIFRYAHNGVNVLPPHDIESIEIYRGLAEVPAEFSGEHARCGVIALWTTRRE